MKSLTAPAAWFFNGDITTTTATVVWLEYIEVVGSLDFFGGGGSRLLICQWDMYGRSVFVQALLFFLCFFLLKEVPRYSKHRTFT